MPPLLPPRVADPAEIRQNIVQALREAAQAKGRRLTKTQLAEQAICGRDVANREIDAMEAEGLIQHHKPRGGYSLATKDGAVLTTAP